MLWTLLGAAIALAALALLAVLALGLWRQVKTLMHVVTAAGETIESASDALAAAQTGVHPDTHPDSRYDGRSGGLAPAHTRPPGV